MEDLKMPQLFRIGGYKIYFWKNENQPLEPVNVHISKGKPSANATKVWLTADKNCKLCHNRSRIPKNFLHNIMNLIADNSDIILDKWKETFGEVKFYC